jgi:murein DD-endopeptidase MepM/ murein hydrolase activator NlpD
VSVLDGRVRAYCSETCKDRARRGVEPAPDTDDSFDAIVHISPWKRPTVRAALGVLIFGGVGLAMASRYLDKHAPKAAASMAVVAQAAKPPARTPTVAEALAVLAANSPDAEENDVWIHPMAGPMRHLPERSTRRFGAAREGMRPEECEGGHCGVDIGVSKGEVVMAVHDGVVERVERDAEVGGRRGNEGRFIRINHKGGTVVSSYIHLDGIREDLRPGIPVKVGEAIGTVGDTGVRQSGPHLHFAISVRASADASELFIDPEPMLHLWPVKRRPVTSLHAMQITFPHRSKTAQADTESPEGM